MGVFSVVLLVVYTQYQNTSITTSTPLLLLSVLIVALFVGYGLTYVEFDNRSARMRKMLMGFLPVASLPFSQLQGINPVSNTAGGYNYRLFRKNARYGKGIVVSSGYSKSDDPNAIAFVDEAVTVVHGYLDLHDSPADFVTQPIASLKYFEQDGSVYAIKTKKAGALIFALFFLGLAVWMFTVSVESLLATLLIIAFLLLMGLVFLNAAFTKIVFDPHAKTVQRTGLFNFFNKHYDFSNFVGIQTIRHSMNFIYVRTSINLYFEVPGKNGKQDILTIGSHYRSKSVERFIQEFYQVMGV
ncbi:hypothetical protein LT679_00805 [Mucilaginibacter roseus]|uniref:PH domain-containing protein n=1 Tax=Mucilaginibacter roseus TaxID=1528868 RepID=A0ABS8TZN1_9SPHI|nr:hypothetical protein [Mucilaginibacter roseus]MCD8739124.1 hypothetical protein [Mucilaginibacter roseus]